MGFSDFMNGASGGSKVFYSDGRKVLVNKNMVKGARVEQNATMTENGKYRDDLAIRLLFDVGLKFDKEYYVGGSFSRERTAHGDGPITGIGGMFKLFRCLEAFGIDGEQLDARASELGLTLPTSPADYDVDDFFVLFNSFMDDIVASQVLCLDYVTGIRKNTDGEAKLNYSRWDFFGRVYEDDAEATQKSAEDLVTSFYDGYNRRGYPKNFKPEAVEAIEQTETSFDVAEIEAASTGGGW